MTIDVVAARGVACPVPQRAESDARVQLGHGSGGKMSAALLKERFLPHFANEVLGRLTDAAVVSVQGVRLALSTDTFVVAPLEFPGGNIGTLAVHGTLNDVAMMGGRPLWLSAGFVLEEGLPLTTLDRVTAAMGAAARAAGVPLVTGDTKVVQRGKADGLFINTTGVALVEDGFEPAPARVQPGDAIVLSGPIGRHGIAVLAARGDLGFDVAVESDTACLWPVVDGLRTAVGGASVHALRDPTRGGVASALNEIAQAASVGMVLDEDRIPLPEAVGAACAMLGFDPLYVANEGVFVAFVPEAAAERAVEALRAHPVGAEAAVIGRVVERHPGMVVLRTAVGGTRVVDLLPGDQLPRIC